MTWSPPYRLELAVCVVLFLALPAFARARAPQPAAMKPVRPSGRPVPRMRPVQPHLQQWMENHKNLSVAEQQRALEVEPGFHDLAPQTQQSFRDQLARLNNMTPQQRSQILQRNEVLESRTPQQREQFRFGMQQYNGLPPNRKMLFRRAFRDLREMPPTQRQEVINSAPFRAEFSDDERSSLTNVLAVEPYPPIGAQTQGP